MRICILMIFFNIIGFLFKIIKALGVVWESHTLYIVKLAEVVSYSAETLVWIIVPWSSSMWIVKSLMVEDKRVGEEAKVEHSVLCIMHLRSKITIWIWYCLFGYPLSNRLRVSISR